MNDKHYIAIWIISVCSFTAWTQPTGEWPAVARDTMSEVFARPLDTSAIYDLRSDSYFIYTTGPKEDETYWERFKRWFYSQFIRPLFDSRTSGVKNVLFLLLGMAGVGILFYFLFKGRQNTAFVKGDVKWGDVFTNPADIAEEQFVQWMNDAESRMDYKEAVKYLYLWSIRQMDAKNFIHYRPEYTNRQVVNKLKNDEIKSIFSSVAKNFEYVWYGHFELSAVEYNELKNAVFQSPLRP